MKLNEPVKVSKWAWFIISATFGVLVFSFLLPSSSPTPVSVSPVVSPQVQPEILQKAHTEASTKEQTQIVKEQPATEEDSEFGASLSECLGKADEWFADAKKTALEVLADEEKRGLYANYDKQKEISRITSSLYEEFSDYKKECRTKFK